MGKLSLEQVEQLKRVTAAKRKLRFAQLEVEERIRQAAFAEIQELNFALAFEARKARALIGPNGKNTAVVEIGRALGTSDYNTVSKLLHPKRILGVER